MEAKDKLEMLLDYTGLKILPFSKSIGQGSQTFYDIRSGKIQSFTVEVANKIIKAYPEINKEWLIADEPNMLRHNIDKKVAKVITDARTITREKLIPILSEPKTEYRREVIPIENEDYMMVEYADLSVQAGPLGTAPISELPKSRTMLVPKEYDNGEYLVLKVDGNSMYKKDSDISIPDGTKILVKKYYLQHGEKLPIRNNLFVIDAKDGQALKQVILHDVENGFIRCHSYNEDFKDYDVKMEDILQIFIYRKVVSSRPPIPDIETS